MAMKVDPRLALDAPLPPKEFERALQLRMPDLNREFEFVKPLTGGFSETSHYIPPPPRHPISFFKNLEAPWAGAHFIRMIEISMHRCCLCCSQKLSASTTNST